MKCPECGSEIENLIHYYHIIDFDEYRCSNKKCNKCFSHKEYEELEQYQARLDKVLSKFEKNRNPKSNEYYYYWTNGLLMAIDIDRETKFSLYNNEFPVYISLDTVESLIKDMEAQE